MQWYVLHTKPNVEYRVAQILREREFEVYLPEIDKKQTISREVAKEPFFPCYLFMKVDLLKTATSSWQWTPGLRGMVAFEGEPVALPEYLIEAIKQQATNVARQVNQPVQLFQKGELIRIAEGPFAEMVAIFNGPSTPGKRVQVLLKVLGQLNRVWLDASHVEKLAPSGPQSDRRHRRRSRGRGRPIH